MSMRSLQSHTIPCAGGEDWWSPPPDSLWRHLGIVERRGLSTGYMSLFKLTFQQFAAFADRNSRVILVIRELVTSHRSNGTYLHEHHTAKLVRK